MDRRKIKIVVDGKIVETDYTINRDGTTIIGPDGKERKIQESGGSKLPGRQKYKAIGIRHEEIKHPRIPKKDPGSWKTEVGTPQEFPDLDERYLKKHLKKDGTFNYSSIEHFKQYYIHRLVWVTFKGNIPAKGYEIDHKDGNKHNNCIDNLECVNKKENIGRALKHQQIIKKTYKRYTYDGIYKGEDTKRGWNFFETIDVDQNKIQNRKKLIPYYLKQEDGTWNIYKFNFGLLNSFYTKEEARQYAKEELGRTKLGYSSNFFDDYFVPNNEYKKRFEE